VVPDLASYWGGEVKSDKKAHLCMFVLWHSKKLLRDILVHLVQATILGKVQVQECMLVLMKVIQDLLPVLSKVWVRNGFY
jgi:hypothetical protein